MSDDDDGGQRREMGVEFGDLSEDLEGEEYPISHDDLLEKYGDREIGLGDTTETLESLIGPVSEDQYEDAGDVRNTVQYMVGDEAVGRKEYSDRGSAPDESTNQSF